MRFLVGEFAHEGNGFCANPTTMAEFQQREFLNGDAALVAHRGRKTVLGGFIEILEKEGHAVVPSIAASALPAGVITADVHATVLNALISAARANLSSLDGVLLSLHGAMIIEDAAGVVDPEGEIAAALREVVGPDIPIVVVLDPHSDTTDLLLASANLTLAYNEEPHRDAYDRGLEAATLIQRIRRGEIRPVRVREHPPMLITGTHTTTDRPPMKDISDLRAALEREPGVIDISVHFGFFGCDQPESGFSVVCTTDGDPLLARRLARQVAFAAWAGRDRFTPVMTAPAEAVALALTEGGPVGVIDECDDPAGGGSAESVTLVAAMLDGGVTRGAVSTVRDTEVARMLESAGAGATVTVTLGGKSDTLHGPSIQVTGTVAKIHRGALPMDHWSGRLYDPGVRAVLDVSGVLVAITERKIVTENIDLFELLGWDVSTMQVVGFKGLGGHIQQIIGPKMQRYIRIDGVGVTHRDVRKVGQYKRINRPIWPLDDVPLSAYREGP